MVDAQVGAAAAEHARDPAGVDGSQSKVMLPMVTWLPGLAPRLARASSTPSFASRSARNPIASLLPKSVCRTQRSGFSPRTTNASSNSGSGSTVKLPLSTAVGRTTTRAGSGGGSSAR